MFRWSPDGKTIAFTSAVYLDCKDDACNAKRDEEKEKSKVKARIYDHLLFRHWDHWSEGKRSHLFVMPVDGSTPAHDLNPTADYDIPPDERSGPGDINFSPDGKEICYTAVPDKVEAISTNGDLFMVPVAGGEPKKHHQEPGLRWQSGVFAGWAVHRIPRAIDRRVRSRPLARDALRPQEREERKHFASDSTAAQRIWPGPRTARHSISLAENETLQPFIPWSRERARCRRKCSMASTARISFSGDGKTLVTERTSLTMPGELFVAAGDGSGLKQLTHHK